MICARQKKSQREQATEWCNNIHMIANPEKLPAIFLSKTDNSVSQKVNIYDINTETTKSIKLPGVEIDHQLRFNQHTSTLSYKEAMQLNALTGLRKFYEKS